MEQGFFGFPTVIRSVMQFASDSDFPTVGDAYTLYVDNTNARFYYYNVALNAYVAASVDLSAYLPLAGGLMSGQIRGSKNTVASAATVDLGAAGANYVEISGTTTISSFGTVDAGTKVTVEFGGSLTITYNAASMILPTGDDITTVSGDMADFISEGSGIWRCTKYTPRANTFISRVSATVGNTVTETTLMGTGYGTRTIAADWLYVGKAYRIRAWGFITNTGTPSIRLRLKMGSTTVADTTAATMGGITGTTSWNYEGVITCRSVGVTGTVFAQGQFTYYTAATALRGISSPSTATVTIDTTAAQTIDLTAQWGTASASNTLTCTNTTIKPEE